VLSLIGTLLYYRIDLLIPDFSYDRDCMTSQEVVDFVHKHLNTVSLAHNCVWVPLSFKFVPSSTPQKYSTGG